VTAKEADRLARQAAAGLRSRAGRNDGDIVAFCIPGSVALLGAILGASRSGLRPAVMNPGLTPAERSVQRSILGDPLCIETEEDLAALFGGSEMDIAEVPLTRTMHFTSGTTGVPKAVTNGLLDERTARTVVEDELAVWDLGPSDRFLMCSPLHHTVAVRFATSVLTAGGELLVTPHFEAGAALASLREDQPTAAFMVPTHLQRVLGHSDLGHDERFSSLRYLAHAGSACPPALKRAAIERVGGKGVLEFYGASETQFAFCSQEEWLERPGTVGRARSGRTLSIRPLEGDHDAGDGVGTIWCDVPEFARWSYLGQPAATAAAWDGASCTVGDLGTLDDDGFLFLTGRRHDLIISGGVNVYPAEIEAALAGTNGVTELAIFGWEDPTWGQRVCCAVVGDDGAVERLRARAQTDLAPFKRPKDYYRLDALPMTSTGKVLRRLLGEAVGLAD
jgi:long-chain acyl-CoA synthetase